MHLWHDQREQPTADRTGESDTMQPSLEKQSFAPTFERRVIIAGTERLLTLYPPRVEQLAGLILCPVFRPALRRGHLLGELNQIADVDGIPIWNQLSKSVIDEPGALAAVWDARRTLYERLVEEGRIHAACPVCG